MIFDEFKKNNNINLYFRSIRNTLLDREPRSKPRNKILRSEEQKTVLKPPKQFKNHNINLTESTPGASDYSLKPPCIRPIVSVEVSKKSVT
jgi:hypothetical protein